MLRWQGKRQRRIYIRRMKLRTLDHSLMHSLPQFTSTDLYSNLRSLLLSLLRESGKNLTFRLFKHVPKTSFQVLLEVVTNKRPEAVNSQSSFAIRSLKFISCFTGELRKTSLSSLSPLFLIDSQVSQ